MIKELRAEGRYLKKKETALVLARVFRLRIVWNIPAKPTVGRQAGS